MGGLGSGRPNSGAPTCEGCLGIDLAWQRVYGYPAPSHVKFNHAPHIRKEIACETCHGPIGQQTVAQKTVDLSMGFCVNCHNERKAPVDCQTCHF